MSYHLPIGKEERFRPGRLAIRYHWSWIERGMAPRWSVTEFHDPMYGTAQGGTSQPEAEWFDGQAWRPIADGYWDAIAAELASAGPRR